MQFSRGVTISVDQTELSISIIDAGFKSNKSNYDLKIQSQIKSWICRVGPDTPAWNGNDKLVYKLLLLLKASVYNVITVCNSKM